MIFFRSMVSLIVLFCINPLDAKSVGRSTPQPLLNQTTVVKQPVAQQPATRQPSSFAKATADTQQQSTMQEKSYKDLVSYVKSASNVWDPANARLNSEFIYTMIKKAQQLNLDNDQLEALLQTARDLHGSFSGNQNTDTSILINVSGQIDAALRQK